MNDWLVALGESRPCRLEDEGGWWFVVVVVVVVAVAVQCNTAWRDLRLLGLTSWHPPEPSGFPYYSLSRQWRDIFHENTRDTSDFC